MNTTGNGIPDEGEAARAALWTGIIIGIGAVGALDEIVFHQLLQWHHFYVHTDEFWRIASDGFFHLFTATLFFIGAIRLWSQRRRISRVVSSRPFWGGILLGGGGFQLFDGTVNHKVLRLHQVREGVENLLLYDIGWILSALLLLIVGWVVLRGRHPEGT